MWQTIDGIRSDIEGYEEKIKKARITIMALPHGFIDYKAHKRREAKRRKAESEILLNKCLCKRSNHS